MAETLFCPICKSDSYINPSIKLYISPCYHKICEQCLNYNFPAATGPCPECGTILRKVNYTSQTFEDLEIEKEYRIRKSINKYLKEEEDFNSLEEYYNYLEFIEDKVFGSINKSEMEINKIVEEMKQEFKEKQIVKKKEERKEAFNWFNDVDFERFEFENEILFVEAFKPKNYSTGFNDFIMAYMAVASLNNDKI